MYRASLSTDADILDAQREAARKFPTLMQIAFKREIGRWRVKWLAALRPEPGAPHYPLRWKSLRQRRFVMAKLRREGNLPYQRTHALVNAWDVRSTLTLEGGEVVLENPTPSARFVIGDDQQPFAIDIGWKPAAKTVVSAMDDLNDRMIEVWYTISNPFGVARR